MSDFALDAYWRFFETFNTRDAYAFSSAMNYPHVRVSWVREPVVLPDQEAHALSVGWDAFIASGWDHTVGDGPEVIGRSDNKVHIAGGWTRFNASNKPILANRVCYIVTRVDDFWGIQCRFGTDPGNDDNVYTESALDQARECATGFLNAIANGSNALDKYTSDEYFVVGVGELRWVKRGDNPAVRGMCAPELRVVQSGPSSVTLNASEEDQTVLLYAVRRESDWEIKAGSWL